MINQPSDDEMDIAALDVVVGEAMQELFELQEDHPLVSFMGISNRIESMRRHDEVIKRFNRVTSRLPVGKTEIVETLGKYLDALRRAINKAKSKVLH